MQIDRIKSLNVELQKDMLESRINQYLSKEYNNQTSSSSQPSHKPSSIGSACYRKIYYEYFRVEKDTLINSKQAKIFEVGKVYEDLIMSWLKNLGEHIPYRDKNGDIPSTHGGSQFPIHSLEWRIKKGYIDNVGVIDGNLWIYEIKSAKSEKFVSLSSPIPAHKDQVSIYYKTFNELLVKGEYSHIPELKGFTKVEGVKVIYINKDNCDLRIFSLKNSDLVNNITHLNTKVKRLNTYIDEKTLPQKTPEYCGTCPFNKRCRKNQNVT